MLSLFQSLFRPRPPEAARAVYIASVAQARNPFFYGTLGVPDTLDGRFDAIVLHQFLLQDRLREAAPDFARFVSEVFFADMDASLRELGVADSGVSRRIKQMGKAYHGRLQAYADGLAQGDETLKEALSRNLFGTLAEGDPAQLAQAADYLKRMREALAGAPTDTITSGNFSWPQP